jgi:hypothetical protein
LYSVAVLPKPAIERLSMEAAFFIKPIAVWQILENFGLAMQKGCPEQTVQTLSINNTLGSDGLTIGKPARELPDLQIWKDKIQWYKENSYLEASTLFMDSAPGWRLRYYSDHNHQGPAMAIEVHDSHRNANVERSLIKALNERFTFITQWEAKAIMMTESKEAGFRFAERTIASFASEAAKLSQSTTQNFESFVAGVKTRTLELEAQFQKKSDELDAKYQKREEELNGSHANKLKDLGAREKEHAEAVKQFELRNNTAVRRDLLKEIRNKIEQQKKIEISPETSGKRRIIHGVCAITLGAAAILIGVFAVKLYNAQTLDWHLMIPMSTWTIVFVTTAIYYIRWNDQWFREHARVEFENRKFSADILRASWVAELFFESAEKKELTMPPQLVASFTKNLFDGATLDGKLHPMDQLNDLIKQFSSLEVNKGGVKIVRDKEKEKCG